MATKSRKKSPRKAAKKTTKKSAKKTAQVQLDPATVSKFESHLREGLVASGAVLMSTETPRLKPGAKVELDSDTAASLAEVLRNGLVSSGAVLASEFPQMEQQPSAMSAGTSRATKKSRRSTSKKK